MLTEEGKKYKEELEARIAARVEAFKIEQRDLLEELAQVGVQVDIVNRLPNVATSDYPATPFDFHGQLAWSRIGGQLLYKINSIAPKYWSGNGITQ